MNIQDILFKMGVGTWVIDIITQFPNPASVKFQVGKNLPDNVGFIYGLSTYCDGVDQDANVLMTTTQAQNTFLTLQDGSTQFLEGIRMDDMLNDYAGTVVVNPHKYLPVAIPAFDLSKSFYQNPNGYMGSYIRLKLWFVQKQDWVHIAKLMKVNGYSYSSHAGHEKVK
jgi:hypothetical protein